MWYIIVFLLSGPVQLGPFPSAWDCKFASSVVLRQYPVDNKKIPENLGGTWYATSDCWEVKP